MRKSSTLSARYLDKLTEEATTDAYNESEQASGFFTMIDENLAMPFVTQVLGQEVTVSKVDLTAGNQIVAICIRGEFRQAIPICDLPMPTPRPQGAEWLDAYRRWLGN